MNSTIFVFYKGNWKDKDTHFYFKFKQYMVLINKHTTALSDNNCK